MLFIHPDECIDCGACEPVCPVKAIFAEDETPDQWKNFIEINKQFFKDNPGRQAGHQVLGVRLRIRRHPKGPPARALRFVHGRHGGWAHPAGRLAALARNSSASRVAWPLRFPAA